MGAGASVVITMHVPYNGSDSAMHIGVTLPQTEIGGSVADLRQYAEGIEQLGYRHLIAYDHIVGADPSVHENWTGPYDIDSTFHEPLVLFGFLAGITKLELVPAIIIMPQRQTALVAKQAAEVDLLTEGRFRFGVGLGWNHVEFEALGEDFATRGKRLDEQVPLLRRLWTERSVTFEGTFDRITAAGIAPLPIQRPIPIWFGGGSPPRVSPYGSPCRRLVSARFAGSGTRSGAHHHCGVCCQGWTRPRLDWHGGSHHLDGQRRGNQGRGRRVAGAWRQPRVDQHDGFRPR